MKKPEKIIVICRCLSLGQERYFHNQVLSGEQITPDIIRELESGTGTLKVVEAKVSAVSVEPTDKQNKNEGVSSLDDFNGDSEDEKDSTDTITLDSEKQIEESVETPEKVIEKKKKAVTPTVKTSKKQGRETKGKR